MSHRHTLPAPFLPLLSFPHTPYLSSPTNPHPSGTNFSCGSTSQPHDFEMIALAESVGTLPAALVWTGLTGAITTLWIWIARQFRQQASKLEDCEEDRAKLWQAMVILSQHVDGIDIRELVAIRDRPLSPRKRHRDDPPSGQAPAVV